MARTSPGGTFTAAQYRDWTGVGRSLARSVQAYNSAAASFETRVLTGARKLRDLDVTTAPDLPPAEPIAPAIDSRELEN